MTKSTLHEVKIRHLLNTLFTLLTLIPSVARAQTDTIPPRETLTKIRVGMSGSAQILDTYLSDMHYKGITSAFISEERKNKDNNKCTTYTYNKIELQSVENNSKNNKYMGGEYYSATGLLYNLPIPIPSLTISVGGGIDILGGIIVNPANSNNPAQAKIALQLAAQAEAAYDFTILNKKLRLTYNASFPFAGLMFSPHYGQSYYEIFVTGKTDHNIVATSFHNAPSFRHYLSLDIPISKITCRIGYLGDFEQSHLHHIKYHKYIHGLTLGVVKKIRITEIR